MNVFTGVKWRQGDHQEDKSSNPISKNKSKKKFEKENPGKFEKPLWIPLG